MVKTSSLHLLTQKSNNEGRVSWMSCTTRYRALMTTKRRSPRLRMNQSLIVPQKMQLRRNRRVRQVQTRPLIRAGKMTNLSIHLSAKSLPKQMKLSRNFTVQITKNHLALRKKPTQLSSRWSWRINWRRSWQVGLEGHVRSTMRSSTILTLKLASSNESSLPLTKTWQQRISPKRQSLPWSQWESMSHFKRRNLECQILIARV